MSIFGGSSGVVTENVGVSEAFIEPTQSGLHTVLFESSRDMLKLNAALYISDVVMEQQVTLEGASTEILMEAFVKDALDKVKQIFVTLWEKVKGWFAKAKRFFQILFTSGANFAKKFKNEIREKSVKGFTYTGFKYTLDAGASALQAKYKVLSGALQESVDFELSEAQFSTAGQEKSIRDKNPNQESFNLDDEKESLMSKLGDKELSEVREQIVKSFRGGETEKEEIEDFSANSKEEMIKWLEEGVSKLRDIEKEEKDVNADFNRVLSSINKAKSVIEKSDNPADGAARGRLAAFATHKYNMAHYVLTIRNSLTALHTDAIKAASRDFESVLKSFLRYKPAKEGFDTPAGDGSSNSVLESALRYL